MSFFSTRGGDVVTASQAILAGLAADGGLYVPAMFPSLSMNRLHQLPGESYVQRASSILRTYLEDYSIPEIDEAVQAAYAPERFDDPAIAPVKRLDDDTYVLELFHGPTLAFKDMALQLLPHLITKAARKNGEQREICILVATSGDTGKAALEGFKDVAGTSCTVFYPMDGVSDVQKLQMVTTGGSNTRVIAVNGNFDDAQTGVKRLFADPEFNAEMGKRGKVLSSANSMNFGRLVPQVVYYFSAYADLVDQGVLEPGEEVNFVVPTGNFGNILAAYYARAMGLPVKKLICASNRNNVLTDFFGSGVYDARRTFYKTTSPSMDILVSSNLERLLFECCGRDSAKVRAWMGQLREGGTYDIGKERLEELRQVFDAGCADDAQTAQEIRAVFDQERYLMDTHTAVASHVLRQYRERTQDSTKTVIVSTASPYKFAADVLSALKGPEFILGRDAFACAELLERFTGVPVPQQVRALQTAAIRHHEQCEKDAMAQALLR